MMLINDAGRESWCVAAWLEVRQQQDIAWLTLEKIRDRDLWELGFSKAKSLRLLRFSFFWTEGGLKTLSP